MYRALAVISASAWLALAPAALAVTHSSSHKPAHAKKGAAEAATSKKAKLRHAAEADEAPSLVLKASHAKGGAASKHRHGQAAVEAPDEEAPAHAAKGSKASKHHGKAVADEEAPPSKSRSKSKHHAAADEEAPETTRTKASSKHRGHAAIEEEADATPSKSRAKSKSRHQDEEAADTSEAKHASKRHGRAAEEEEAAPVERVGLKSTRSCVAAHIRAHGRPKGAKARAALQRECVKEVEAARRKAEEEAMIRNWSAPRGPLIYPGAMPRSPVPAAVPEPAPVAPGAPAPSTTVSVEPAPSDVPVKGVASVEQKPAASAQSNFLSSLWSRVRRGPQRAPGSPAPTLAGLVGSDEARLKAELGEPELMRAEGDGALWTYKLPGCALYVFLGRDAATGTTPPGGWKVKGAQAGPLKRGGAAPDVDVCLKGGRS